MKEEIQRIIDQRGILATKLASLCEEWQKRKKDCLSLKQELLELKRVCLRGQNGDNGNVFMELLAYIEGTEREQTLQTLQFNANFALSRLQKLNQRFNRKTINIAVAGVGRCGKSSALKSIIGQRQSDNSTIPSGNGPAVTASKSTICCVLNKDEECAQVFYHDAKSFLDYLVNPILENVSLPEYRCQSLDDFELLDYKTLENVMECKRAEAKADLDAAEAAVYAACDDAAKVAAENKLLQLKAYLNSFTSFMEGLDELKRIFSAYPCFKTRLTGDVDRVPLNQTYRYVSYPKNGEPALCYAVRECKIYSQFPNNGIQTLELTDLPGLGTASQSEKRCFKDGFNYGVDFALVIRRPEGLFQNFPTENDETVLQVLTSVFGAEHLHEVMMLFQNDASLPQSDVERSFEKIEEWNKRQAKPIDVVRGNAFDADFMQNKLLARVLSFIARNLPVLDQAFIDATLPDVENKAQEFDSLKKELFSKLSSFKRLFPDSHGANAIYDKTEEIRNILMNGISALITKYGGDFESEDSRFSEAIDKQTVVLRNWINAKYNPQDDGQIEAVKNSIRSNQSAVIFANREIHSIRIKISEVYSELEKVHDSLISDMQQATADVWRSAMPGLIPENSNLANLTVLAERAGDCVEIIDAIESLASVTVPFYNVLYPELRKDVFDSVEEIQKNFYFVSNSDLEKRAKNVLIELQNVGINWVWKAQNLLHAQTKVLEIISSQLERFLDRIIRNDVTKRELIAFVEYYWSDIQSGTDGCCEDVRAKLEKYNGERE